LLSVVGFLILGKAPVLIVLVIFQVVRRAGNYSLMRPARETLFTILPRDQKYKAKSFIDTFVYRGGDVLGASFFDVLTRAGLGLAGIAYTAVPFAIIWGLLGITLGRKQSRLAASTDNQGANP
jgi:ATP:ADP antiporter, AAA family